MMPGNSSQAIAIPSSAPAWAKTLHFDSTFEETKARALELVRRWYPNRATEDLDLSEIEACVAVKNQQRSVVHDNAAHQYFFAATRLAGGNKASETAPQYRTTKLSHDIEELIAEGIRSLDCEHEAKVAAGQSYCFRTYKCQLEELHDPNYFLISISRPTACLSKENTRKEKSLDELLDLFQSLDNTDQITCRMDAKGECTKDIALAVGLSPRAIELRRKKMFELFGVERPMELIRITIRLEENGLLPE